MKITLKVKDFSPKEQKQFLDMIYKDGLTLEEAKEKMISEIIDDMISHFDKENFVFPDMYVDKKIKLKADFTNAMTKYMSFYEYIKHLLKNANLDEKLVRRKIEEMEKEIENED